MTFACPTGKVRFKSRRAAAQAIRGNACRGRRSVKLQAYECPECDGFHLTTRRG